MQIPFSFLSFLKLLTKDEDRYIKGHARALLERLQALNPQDHD